MRQEVGELRRERAAAEEGRKLHIARQEESPGERLAQGDGGLRRALAEVKARPLAAEAAVAERAGPAASVAEGVARSAQLSLPEDCPPLFAPSAGQLFAEINCAGQLFGGPPASGSVRAQGGEAGVTAEAQAEAAQLIERAVAEACALHSTEVEERRGAAAVCRRRFPSLLAVDP